MKRTLFGLSILWAMTLAAPAGAQPAAFTPVSSDAAEIDFDEAVVAINCGDATYEVRGVTFWAYNAAELNAYCDRSTNNVTAPIWNGSWTNPFDPGDPDLDFLDEVYMSISYYDQLMSVDFKGLRTGELYKVQTLWTANTLNTWDHGGSLKIIGAEEEVIFSNVHLNTFARDLPFVVTVDDIQPSAEGIIRIEYYREGNWVCSPACDFNKIWSGIILNGPPPIAYPTDLAVASDGETATVTWVNHEPSGSATPYDQIEIIADGEVRGILADGPGVIDEATDNSFAIDLKDPANADLLAEGVHMISIRTSVGASASELSVPYGLAPIRVAVGDYGAGFTGLETSDGRVWAPDTGIVKTEYTADWMVNVPFDGIPNLDEFGLDPFDATDQSLFALFRYDAGGGLENHMTIRVAIPDGTYDVRLYFWEYDSPWIRARTGEVSVEGGPKTFFCYADDMDEFAPLPNLAWSILFESVEVDDGRLDIDVLNGWGLNRDVTLSALEVLAADPAPTGPRDFRVTKTGPRMYDLAWDLPAGADHDAINLMTRMSGQNEYLDGAATSFTFEQEAFFETTDNEAFVLQARKGNTFYAQLHAGAGSPPMYINAGGGGNVNAGIYVETPIEARGLTWVSDLPYVDRRRQFVAPVVSGDLNYVNWVDYAFGTFFSVTPGSPADDLDPPFDNPDNLQGGELQFAQEIRWCEGPPANDPMQRMTWEIPISPPDPEKGYFVRLYLTEGCCIRATDIVVEGSDPQRIYYNGLAMGDSYPDDRDYVEGLAGTIAIMEFDGVLVDDGFLTIEFLPFCSFNSPYDSNATVTAIEILGEGTITPPEDLFIRGDTDGNGVYTIGDGVQILNLLFDDAVTALTSDCDDAGDVDDNGVFTIGDAVMMFNFLFASGIGPAGQPLGAGGTPLSCIQDTSPSASMRKCNYPATSCP
ncbi:MAG: hypothetical protein JXP34_07715 [Planctomycetes bacterium]|nr:hypothetical protein [Planctomycetota bacterium]